MAELDSVRELLVLCVLRDDREGVVMQGGTNVGAILSAEVPRCPFTGFGMDENVAASIEATIEILTGLRVAWRRGLKVSSV